MTSDCPEKGSFCHPLRAPADEQPLLGAGDNNRKRSQPMRRLKTIVLTTATLSVLTLGTMTAQSEYTEGGGGEDDRFQSAHRLTPFPVVIPSPKKWLFVRRRPQRVAERTLFRAV